jgi:putative FmdB family regulatory protein
MPIYTYSCEKCKTEFDAFASIQKKESGWQPVCPKCGSVQTRQIYKPVAMITGSQRPSTGGSGCCSNRGG